MRLQVDQGLNGLGTSDRPAKSRKQNCAKVAPGITDRLGIGLGFLGAAYRTCDYLLSQAESGVLGTFEISVLSLGRGLRS